MEYYYIQVDNMHGITLFFTGYLANYQEAIAELQRYLLDGKKATILKGKHHDI